MQKKLEELYVLIRGIDVVMLTTRRLDGHLVARPMQTQAQRAECDLWLAAYDDAHLLEEIERDPNVCLAYQGDDDWISVSGTARVLYEGAGAAHVEITVDTAVRFVGRVTEVLFQRDRAEPVPAEDFHHFG